VKLASGDASRDQRYLIDGDHIPFHAGETSGNVAHLALALMAELGACMQMITSDIAQATDLDVASKRWLQRLMALVALIEQVNETHNTPITGQGRSHREKRSALPKSSVSQSSTFTTREREIMGLTRKGYPPRRIAKHLQLSVTTVYTHLRNIRRKRRLLDIP
jgi:DNA-binding CsgD family transcriptional regulator